MTAPDTTVAPVTLSIAVVAAAIRAIRDAGYSASTGAAPERQALSPTSCCAPPQTHKLARASSRPMYNVPAAH